jgi:hypothetical protein
MSKKPGSSKYKGVSWYKPHDKWRASILVNGKAKHLGYFPGTPEGEIQAAKCYDAAARKLLGEDAFLNFPETPG